MEQKHDNEQTREAIRKINQIQGDDKGKQLMQILRAGQKNLRKTAKTAKTQPQNLININDNNNPEVLERAKIIIKKPQSQN